MKVCVDKVCGVPGQGEGGGSMVTGGRCVRGGDQRGYHRGAEFSRVTAAAEQLQYHTEKQLGRMLSMVQR